jgi:hypothetical protein
MSAHMSKYDPKEAVKYIVHDYLYLVAAGTDTQRGTDFPFNHYAERTFLTHCRALGDFFDPKMKGGDDLHANDFTKKKFSADLRTWNGWRKHMNKHLMHLTVGRIKNKRPWDGKPNKAILKEFTDAWSEFLDALKPGLRPLFDEEIKRQGKGFKGYPV